MMKASNAVTGTLQSSSGPGAKTYASKSANLHLTYRTWNDDGTLKAEWTIPFNGSKAAKFGVFTTTDKGVQEFLDQRIKNQRGASGEDEPDVMLLEDFMKTIVPAKVQIKNLESELEKVKEQNRLLEMAAGKAIGVGQAGQSGQSGQSTQFQSKR